MGGRAALSSAKGSCTLGAGTPGDTASRADKREVIWASCVLEVRFNRSRASSTPRVFVEDSTTPNTVLRGGRCGNVRVGFCWGCI